MLSFTSFQDFIVEGETACFEYLILLHRLRAFKAAKEVLTTERSVDIIHKLLSVQSIRIRLLAISFMKDILEMIDLKKCESIYQKPSELINSILIQLGKLHATDETENLGVC